MHPLNQMGSAVGPGPNRNAAFGLSGRVTATKAGRKRTSTRKFYFLTGFLVIFADFNNTGHLWQEAEETKIGPEPTQTLSIQ